MKKPLDKLREDIYKWRENNTYPDISHEKFFPYFKEYPLWMYAKRMNYKNQMISLENIYGDNWCFESKETRGNYPKPSKLLSLLEGYEKGASIPPVELYLIDGRYFFSEGNHRVYLTTLLGNESILADVWEVFYDEFLRDSMIYRESEFEGIIEYNDELIEIEENELQQYKKKKGIL